MFRCGPDNPVEPVTIRSVRRLRVLLVQGLLILVVGELLLHIYNPLPFRVRGNRIILPVDQRYTFHNDGASKLDPVTHHTKNSLGFRGPEPPRDFSTRLTVLTIGGSTTECLFLSDGRTWTDQLARRLAPAFARIWVNNAGLDGQSTYGHLILLRDFVDGLRPRVAVFLIGANEIGLDASNPYDTALVPPASPVRSAVSFLTDHSELAGLAQNLVRVARAHNGGFGHGQIDLTTIRHLEHDPKLTAATIAQFSKALPSFAARVAAIVEECRRHGIEPVLVTQPWLNGDAIDPTTGVNLATIQVRGAANGRLWWQVQELYNDVTRRTAAAHDVLLVDAARELPKDSRLFYDFMHFTNDGAARLGDIVSTRLEPRLRALE
jgi:lysophospholipase L1-like esterase